jgi:tetrahydromethanopterin S-methyltransferase subunit C
MAHRRDHDDASMVIHGVDHAVVARADAQVRVVASQGHSAGRPRVGAESLNDLGNRLTRGAIKRP